MLSTAGVYSLLIRPATYKNNPLAAKCKKFFAFATALLIAGSAAFADLYRVSYTLRGSGKKITINAESSSEARRVVQDLFPGCYVTGTHKVKQ